MKDKFKESFRQPEFQGLLECWIVFLLNYLVASYTNQWYLLQNSLAVYLFGVLKYFELSFFSFNPPALLYHAFYLSFSKCQSTFQFSSGFIAFNGKLDQPIPYLHYLLIAYGVEYTRVHIPKGLTFAEAFSLTSVIAHYTSFYIEAALLRYHKLDGFVAGSNYSNIVIFVTVSSD